MRKTIRKKLFSLFIMLCMLSGFIIAPTTASAVELPTVKLECIRYNPITGEGDLKISLIDFYNASGMSMYGGVIRLKLDSDEFDTSIYSSSEIEDNVWLSDKLHSHTTGWNSK